MQGAQSLIRRAPRLPLHPLCPPPRPPLLLIGQASKKVVLLSCPGSLLRELLALVRPRRHARLYKVCVCERKSERVKERECVCVCVCV